MSGIGNISHSASVGYTEINGLGLNSATQNQVKLDSVVSDAMADDILAALAEFRAEGNFNPTAAEMEAKLSVVSVAAKQSAINQAQDLLFGLQQTYQLSLQATGGNVNGRTQLWCQLAESGGTVPANAMCDGAPSLVAGMTIAGVFGASVADFPGGPEGLLSSLIPNTFNTNMALNRPPGYWGDGHLTPATMKTMINALQTKISEMKSADPSSFHNASGAAPMTAAQWLSREMGVQNLHESYSLTQWGDIAQKLQVNAALKASQLSLGRGGGIQQVNGQYFVNGEQLSLSQVNFCVRVNQYQLIDQQIADQLDAIQRNNDKAKQAQAVLAAFQVFDSEELGLNQSASVTTSSVLFANGSSTSALASYLSATFDVSATSTPSLQSYANMVVSGSPNTDVTTITDLLTQLPSIVTSPFGNTTFGQGVNAAAVCASLAGYLGLTPITITGFTQTGAIDAKYAEVRAKLAILAPGFTPPISAQSWNSDTMASLTTALTTQKTSLLSREDPTIKADMKGKLEGFFATLKAAAPAFYSSHVRDTDGGPPYSFTGNISNTAFTDLKANFSTWLQSNSTDNQVAQQRLEALNNTRQSVLDGLGAFTQGQAQVSTRIAGNF